MINCLHCFVELGCNTSTLETVSSSSQPTHFVVGPVPFIRQVSAEEGLNCQKKNIWFICPNARQFYSKGARGTSGSIVGIIKRQLIQNGILVKLEQQRKSCI